jgi:hypothetical protein
MSARFLSGILLASVACAPQNAQLERGSYTAFLSLNTSPVFVDGSIRVEDTDQQWAFDCRALVDESFRFSHPTIPLIDNCRANGGVDVDDGVASRQIIHEEWANRDAFVVVREELEPWRGEAVMTSEGDLNVTFHHNLPGGDFRFAFAIKPTFAPRECRERDGVVAFEPVDGDWIEGWSRAVNEPNYDGFEAELQWPEAYAPRRGRGHVFMLNAFSYQFDPDDRTRVWSLPPQWRAGYARARWGPEELFFVPTRFGRPRAYTAFDEQGQGPALGDLFYVSLNPNNFDEEDFESEVRSYGPFINMMRLAERTGREMQDEMASLYPSNVPADTLRPVVPSHAWRKPDGVAAGLQGWGEINPSWVRFDQDPSEIEVGASLSGNFAMRFYGATSQSQVFVQGYFEIPRVKKDRWVTRNVNEDKRIENQTSVCGE